MARAPTKTAKGKVDYADMPTVPLERFKSTARWQTTYGMYITGQTLIDEVTMLADRMSSKWGAGRLRLIVGPELREKFDRQRYLLNQAIWHGELEDVRQQTARMMKAWQVLDQAATDAGLMIQLPEVWDIESASGNIYAFVRNKDDAKVYQRDGRTVTLMSLEEVVAILDAQSLLREAKEVFPGSEVVGVARRAVGDLLEEISDTRISLDDPLDDSIDDL